MSSFSVALLAHTTAQTHAETCKLISQRLTFHPTHHLRYKPRHSNTRAETYEILISQSLTFHATH